MLYVFHGSDVSSSQKKATTLVTSLREKKPDASYVRIESSHWTPSIVEEHLGGQGLFSNKYIIYLDRVTENSEAKEGLVEYVSAMKESANIFIVFEGKVVAEYKKAFEKHADKVVESDEPTKPAFGKSNEFNIFALADAVGERNRFKAWSLYRQAIDTGLEPENIIGTLFWQLKSMSLVAQGRPAHETGLSPFVFSKAKKAAEKYSKEELGSFTKQLITLYHDGHRGMCDVELGVERLMLRI
ncbi:MAG: hypothetical protein M3Q80_00270 [bacterium]|nr:hypothetical protein [bacterium]